MKSNDDPLGAGVRQRTRPNSNLSRRERDADLGERPIKQIAKATVRHRSRGMIGTILDRFVTEDITDVGTYVVADILIPTLKTLILEMLSNGSERFLFGDGQTRARRGGSRARNAHVSYGNFYRDEEPAARRPAQTRRKAGLDDIVLETRGEAEDVIGALVEIIDQYSETSVSDLYELVGITGDFTDQSIGWTNLSKATCSRVRNGYALNLPRPIQLEL